MKRITPLYLDYEIVQELKKRNINISLHVNSFLETELGIKQLESKDQEVFELKRKNVMLMDANELLLKENRELKKKLEGVKNPEIDFNGFRKLN